MVSNRKANLAIRSQLCLSVTTTALLALKKAMVATKEATKESIKKKCPICPGSKCSPMYFMYQEYVCHIDVIEI